MKVSVGIGSLSSGCLQERGTTVYEVVIITTPAQNTKLNEV